MIAKAGHYAAMEQPAEFGRLLRTFFDSLPRTLSDAGPCGLLGRYFFVALPSMTGIQLVPSFDISYLNVYEVGDTTFMV